MLTYGRIQTLESVQSQTIGTATDQIVHRVLERVSDADLDLLGTAGTPARITTDITKITPRNPSPPSSRTDASRAGPAATFCRLLSGGAPRNTTQHEMLSPA
jgi:hypothetical protein